MRIRRQCPDVVDLAAGAAFDRDAFRDVADRLVPFDSAAAGVYAARTRMDQVEIAATLDKETWIGGQATVNLGFADGLIAANAVDQAQAQVQAAGKMTPLAAQKKIELMLAGKATNPSAANFLRR